MATYGVKMVILMATLCCVTLTSAKVYTVGDLNGWTMSVDYTAWASDKTFLVGDSLVFNYASSHTVDEVSSDDYTACTVGNSIASYNSGTTTIALNTTGSHNFICGIAGHCNAGMKLTVDVTSGSGAGIGSPSAAPSSIAGDSPTTSPFGTTLAPPTVAGTNNIPLDSSSSAISLFVTAVFSLVAFMSTLIIAYGIKLVSLMALLSCITFTSAKVYSVGDSSGWALGVDYTAWTSDKTFFVGDNLCKLFSFLYLHSKNCNSLEICLTMIVAIRWMK
ncbi:hypothetical protein LXL04_030143 [Taraxacum kok-saghyz]